MTITLTREEAQQVLETLTFLDPRGLSASELQDDAIELLRARLSAPEPEPEHVATIGNWGKVMWREGIYPQFNDKLYTAPPQREWQGLTDEEMIAAWSQSKGDIFQRIKPFARAIEVKLKEKNT